MSAVTITVDAAVRVIVRPLWFVAAGLRVRGVDAALDEPLARAASAARMSGVTEDIVEAVRTMYKRVGLDPTRTRPSSEALLRRVRKGEQLPRINSMVDVVNWCSLESGLPFGLYDLDRIAGAVTLRLGRAGEEYAGIRKDVVHVAGRLTLADDRGPFGNPSADSARTMVTTATERALVVVFAPAWLREADVAAVSELAEQRVGAYCLG